MPQTPDPSKLATSFVYLIQRFTGNQPDALAQMRAQIEAERTGGLQMVERATAQLLALDQLEALIEKDAANGHDAVAVSAPPLKRAILRVLDEDPQVAWHRDQLFAEVVRRGWGPGGVNPRNTFTSRLRDLEKENRVRRSGDMFSSKKNEGVPAM